MTMRSLALLLLLLVGNSYAADQPGYKPAKVVYDVASPSARHLKNVFDRISMLQGLYHNDPIDASIVVVVHEGAIPLFSKRRKLKTLMARAQSFSSGDVIKFRICRASARMQGYSEKDFPGFIKMVPMADAEIIKLQHQGYAYMR